MSDNHAKKYFQALLRGKVKAAHARGRSYKPPRMRKPPRPINIQREYTHELDQMVKYLNKLFAEEVYPKLPAIIDKAQAHRSKADSSRRDAYSDDVDHIMNTVEIRFKQKYSKPVKTGIIRHIGNLINNFSKKVFEGQIETLVGTNVFVSEPWLNEEMSAFVKENVDLITKWSDALKSQAEEIIMRGARSGSNPSDIASELKDRIGVVGSRYDMIARDQTNKFNSQLTMVRQQDLGLDKYTWDTSHDERVRASHAELDGQVFSYDDPPVTNEDGDTNNPGEDYNCRCAAIPYIDDIIGDIEDDEPIPEGESEEESADDAAEEELNP